MTYVYTYVTDGGFLVHETIDDAEVAPPGRHETPTPHGPPTPQGAPLSDEVLAWRAAPLQRCSWPSSLVADGVGTAASRGSRAAAGAR